MYQRMFCLWNLPRGIWCYVLCFKSLSHFDCILVHCVRVCFNFTDLHATVQVSQYHLLVRLSFSHSCLLCQSFSDHRLLLCCKVVSDSWYLDLFLGSPFCSIGLYVVFMPVPYCFSYCRFVIYFEMRKCNASSFDLKTALASQGNLWYHMSFRTVFSILIKKYIIRILIGITLNL